MNSEYKKVYFVTTALSVILGIVMLAVKGAYQITAIALGAALAIYGAVKVIMCWKKDRLGVAGGAARGLMILLLGVLALRWNDKVTTMVRTILGAGLIADGFTKLQLSFILKRCGAAAWKRDAIGSAVFMAIGVFFMFDPFAGEKAITVIAGIVLLLNGIANLWIANEVKKSEIKES